MGKMDEIKALLIEGVPSNEVIARGYNPNTVYICMTRLRKEAEERERSKERLASKVFKALEEGKELTGIVVEFEAMPKDVEGFFDEWRRLKEKDLEVKEFFASVEELKSQKSGLISEIGFLEGRKKELEAFLKDGSKRISLEADGFKGSLEKYVQLLDENLSQLDTEYHMVDWLMPSFPKEKRDEERKRIKDKIASIEAEKAEIVAYLRREGFWKGGLEGKRPECVPSFREACHK